MENKTRGIEVNVVVDTEILQDGQTEKHHFDETGQLMKLNGVTYLRYVETSEAGKIPVTYKIEPDRLRLSRKGPSQLNLEFVQGKKTNNIYVTPYGKMQLGVLATLVNVEIDAENHTGKIAVDYQLFTGDEKAGDYKIRLHFS